MRLKKFKHLQSEHKPVNEMDRYHYVSQIGALTDQGVDEDELR